MERNRLALVIAVMVCLAFTLAVPASAGVIGGDLYVSPGGGNWWPDVAYGSANGMFLVVWCDYNYSPIRITGRFVSNSGAVVGNAFLISNPSYGGWYPAVAYNATNNEFLVAWDDDRGGTWGQRVRASDGVLLGGNFGISANGNIRPSIAWSSASNCYGVATYQLPAVEVYVHRLSNTGAVLSVTNCSNDGFYSGYPSIAYSTSGNQFLVTWDSDASQNGNIEGQRVDAATGAPLGGKMTVASGACDCRSQVTYDSINARWLVMFQNLCGAGVDQWGQIINANGTFSGGRIPIAATASFEGETNLGCDIAYAAGVGRYLGTFQRDDNMTVQELYASGALLGGQATIGSNTGGPMSNASDGNNRFLSVWNASTEGGWIRARLYEAAVGAPPSAVSNFTATALVGQINLTWTNPSDSSFTGTMIRFSTTGVPATPNDGTLLVNKAGTPGANDSYTHNGVTDGVTYYYAAFAHDNTPVYSEGRTASATPGLMIIPKPQELTWKTGTGFLVNASTQIMANSNPDANEQNTATQLQRKVWDMTGYLPAIVYGGSSTSNVIAIGDPARCPAVSSIIATFPEASGKAAKSEGYMLGVKDTSIVIRGFDSAGTFYGCQTLIQVLEYYRTTRIAPLFCYDYPELAWRGAYFRFKWEHDWDFTKELISEMMARYKLNRIAPEIHMASVSHPEIPIPNPTPVTLGSAIDILNFMRLHYVTDIVTWFPGPPQDGTQYPEECLLDQTRINRINDLWSDVATYLNPQYVHTHASEISALGCAAERAVYSNEWLYNTMLWQNYNGTYTAHGMTPLIWGDMLRPDWNGGPPNNTAGAVATMPGNMIIADWEYGLPGNVPTDYPSLDRWISYGRKALGVPYGFGSYPAYNQYYGDKENIYYWANAVYNRSGAHPDLMLGIMAFNKYMIKDRNLVVSDTFEQQLLGCFPYYGEWGWNPNGRNWSPYPYGNGWGMVLRELAPARVSNLTATPSGSNVNLAWTNPSDSTFQAAYIVYRTDRYPTSPIDGTYLADVAGSSYTHTGAPAQVYYGVFSHDNVRHFSPVAKVKVGGYCFEENFSYTDGGLNGKGGWTGSATSSQIQVVGQYLRINGGAGAYDAVKTTSCGASGSGFITVTVKINGEVGSSTIWNLWIDDSSSRNLARWYGSGTTARGRIGGTASVTSTQTLTGAWDTLKVKINPAANTTEFFFNGVSLGTLSHASEGSADIVGRIRFERIDSGSATGEYLYFDDLTIGEPLTDTTAPGNVTSFTATAGAGQNSLSWANPGDSDFAGVKIMFKTSGYPTGPTDGTQIYSGTGTSTVHGGLTNGTTYYYKAFAYDAIPNYASGAQASATPALGYCFRDEFPYSNGALNGNGGWSGTATSSQIAIDNQCVKIWGGTGSYDAIKTVSCTDQGLGYIWVRLKVNGEVGNFTMWSLWINDSSGRNLARWYGNGTTARGRIGNTGNVTAQKNLSGAWETIDVRINPSANTSEFFFNGVSIGTLSHASEGAGDAIGQLRFERVNNSGGTGDHLFLDDLRVGGL